MISFSRICVQILCADDEVNLELAFAEQLDAIWTCSRCFVLARRIDAVHAQSQTTRNEETSAYNNDFCGNMLFAVSCFVTKYRPELGRKHSLKVVNNVKLLLCDVKSGTEVNSHRITFHSITFAMFAKSILFLLHIFVFFPRINNNNKRASHSQYLSANTQRRKHISHFCRVGVIIWYFHIPSRYWFRMNMRTNRQK